MRIFKNCCSNESRHGCGRKIMAGIAIVTLFALGFGLITQALWNWLAPAVFHLGEITYLQAVGLVVLARILFHGGPHCFHGGHHGHHGHHKWSGWKCREDKSEACEEEDWRYYNEWWSSEGREAFRKYSGEKHDADKDAPPAR